MSSENCYQITICQDGKFAITFDTVNLRIKILENTDYRPFENDKDSLQVHSNSENDKDSLQVHSNSEKINKTIAHFKINDDLTINKFYKPEAEIKNDGANDSSTEDKDKFRWSFDISNIRKREGSDEYFILVAISCIDVEKDLRETNCKKCDYETGYLDKKTIDEIKYENDDVMINMTGLRKGTAIYCLKLMKNQKESKKEVMLEKELKEKESEEEQKKESEEQKKESEEQKEESEEQKEVSEEQKKESEEQKEEMENSYRYVLIAVDIFSFNNSRDYRVSGVCKFVDVTDKSENNVEQERFIVLNFHGIYNFEYNNDSKDISFNLKEKFDYPKSIRRELDNWYTNTIKDEGTKSDCMRRLRSCIYDKYLLITQYKNDVQSLEVYNLAKMELETTAKKDENKDKLVRRYNYDTFSVSRLQFCFTRGINRVMLYCKENGLQVASKKFDEIEEIHLLEFNDSDKKILIIGKNSEEKLIVFIIWDLYNTDKIKPIKLKGCSIEDLDARLATTPGNILHVDDKGNVTSILKRIENELKELKQEKEPKQDRDAEPIENNNDDKYNKICYDKNEEDTPLNFNKDNKIISNFKNVSDGIEPWVSDYYEKNSYCLYYNKNGTETESLQLIVGRTSIQIWHHFQDKPEKKDNLPNKGDPFLEYIWTNGIPVNQEGEETKLRIEYFKYRSNDENDGSNHKLNNFSLKVYWYIRKEEQDEGIDEENKEMEKGTMEIKRKDIIETFRPIRHACKALKHLNKRYVKKCLADNYNKVHKYEAIVAYIERIVWRFAKYNPEKFNLLDIRYNFIKSLILGDCDRLIKFILFGDEENNKNEKKHEIRHIPRNVFWPGKTFIKYDDDLDFDISDNDENIKPENDMELAIYHCKGRELKDAIIVAYLLEYYSEHATDYASWMCTVSKALPLLFKYNYDDFIRKLFRKECFANQHHFLAQGLDLNEITMEYLGRLNNVIKFRVTEQPIVKLNSDKVDKRFWHGTHIFHMKKYSIYTIYEFFFGKNHKKPPLALGVVPLPDFTINKKIVSEKEVDYNYIRIILNIILFIFIPQQYKIKPHDLSPFSRMILYENNDDIYDNPAIEAVIDFRWQKAKNKIIFTFIRILIFAVCFVIVSWEYLVHEDISERYRNFLVALMIIFYYLAIYLIATEGLQLKHHGLKKYVDLFNFFDVCSVILPVIVLTIMVIKEFQLSNGFGNVEMADIGLIVGISFSVFFFWIELIFHLRLISRTGIYLYYSIIIFKTILPFFFFMLITILAFAHSMFILLRDPVNISTKDQTLSGSATNTLTNEILNIQLKSDFDPTSRVDNPFSSFLDATVAAYFWINGNWIQRDEFDFWVIDAFTVIASIFLVIFIQNLLIAYMGGMHEKADTEGRQIFLRRRARHIADYEALHYSHFSQDEPKQIYYFGYLKSFEDWLKIIKDDQNAIYEDFEEKSTKHIFEDDNYDTVSILKNDTDIDIKIEIVNMRNDLNVKLNNLTEKSKGKKNEIEHVKNMINTNFDYLIKTVEEDNKEN